MHKARDHGDEFLRALAGTAASVRRDTERGIERRERAPQCIFSKMQEYPVVEF